MNELVPNIGAVYDRPSSLIQKGRAVIDRPYNCGSHLPHGQKRYFIENCMILGSCADRI
jgi:hypothetical protein